MQRTAFIPFLIALFIVVAPVVAAQEGRVTLLALSEQGNQTTGSVADLFLEMQSGKERVFLETFPLTKASTQISMRFAQQIACKELNVDCTDKDFFFTINALPGIVGGPSAGGAATVLTAALLKNLTLDTSVAMTGSINSGGVIGPVGGVEKKIKAGAQSGLKKILIPKWSRIRVNETDNTTEEIDFITLGDELGIEVIEVSTFAEALQEFTGYEISKPIIEFVIDDHYKTTMKQVGEELCDRLSTTNNIELDNESIELFTNLTRFADEAFLKEEYYAAASYCFRANVLVHQAEARDELTTEIKIKDEINQLRHDITKFDEKTSARQLETITDLQTFMMVKERILEAQQMLDEVQTFDEIEEKANLVSFAGERFESAKSWANFFSNEGRVFVLNDERIKKSCASKIGEAEERYNYVQTIVPRRMSQTRDTLDSAYRHMTNSNFALCLHQASKAKAEADAVLSLLGVTRNDVQDVFGVKANIVSTELAKAQQKGIFPLIGISYFEYAKSLKDRDPGSAMLFLEYALELSNLDIYFEQRRSSKDVVILPPEKKDISSTILVGVIALIIGIIIGLSATRNFKTRARPRKALRGKKR